MSACFLARELPRQFRLPHLSASPPVAFEPVGHGVGVHRVLPEGGDKQYAITERALSKASLFWKGCEQRADQKQ